MTLEGREGGPIRRGPRAVLAAGLCHEGIGRAVLARRAGPDRLETAATLRVDVAAG